MFAYFLRAAFKLDPATFGVWKKINFFLDEIIIAEQSFSEYLLSKANQH